MDDSTMAMQQMLVMVIIIAIGFVATKLGLLDDSMLKKMTRLLVYITLPCMILASVSKLSIDSGEAQLFWSFGLGILLMGVSVASTFLFNFVFRTPKGERVLYLFMSICTNVGFIGISVASAIYGSAAVFSSSVFVLLSNVFTFSLGFMILDTGRPDGTSLRPKSLKDVLQVLKSLLNPPTVACVLSMLVFAAGIPVPALVENVLGSVGGITAPMAMMLVGVIIAGIHPKEMVKGWRIYAFIAFRQLLVPVVALAILLQFSPDITALRVFVIMAAMPVGTMASMFVTEFGYDSTLVAKTTVLSTLLSFAIVPFLLGLVAMWA